MNKSTLMKIAGLALLTIGMASLGFAGIQVPDAPEIDAATGANALALLGGAVLMIRGRKR